MTFRRARDRAYNTALDRDNAQLLVNELFALPVDTVEDAVVVTVSRCGTHLWS